jgi:hypothetical protein
LSRINYSVKIDERLADRLRYRARRDGVPMRTLVDLACSGEIALGEHLIKLERPGDCAREMFRLARPEVPR